MLDLLTRSWWVLVLRGLAAVAFGILAVAWPEITLATLVLMFGAYVLIDGGLMIVTSLRSWHERDDRWLMLLGGVLGVGIGILTFRAPGLTTMGLLLYIAAWSLAIGALNVISAIRLRKTIEGELWLALSGVAAIAFAVIVLWNPAAGALSVLWLIAAYAIVYGLMLAAVGIEIRMMRGRLKPATPATSAT